MTWRSVPWTFVANRPSKCGEHFLRETADQVGPPLEAYRRVFSGEDDRRDSWRKVRAMNELGVARGTLQLV